MWKLLAKMSAVVFAASLVALSAIAAWRTGEVNWRIVFFLAFAATALFAIRAYFPLRDGARRLFIRREVRRRHERLRMLGAAVNELIQSMARLSPADLSLYFTLLEKTDEGETACVVTSRGSPNHDVLVQMTDLRLARPEELKTLGSSVRPFTIARYALTPFGRSYLPKLMPDIMKVRHLLDSRNASD